MKKLIMLGFAIATPALAEAATVSPAEAASMALKQCIAHVGGTGRVEGNNAKNLEQAGFAYQRDAPDFLSVTQQSALGRGEYIRAPASDGQVWAIGYDKGSCMVVSLGTEVKGIEDGYKAVFNEPGSWRSATAGRPPAGQRTEAYQFDPNRSLKLSAIVNYQDAEGISSVTVTRRTR